jgi:hypothetical protein
MSMTTWSRTLAGPSATATNPTKEGTIQPQIPPSLGRNAAENGNKPLPVNLGPEKHISEIAPPIGEVPVPPNNPNLVDPTLSPPNSRSPPETSNYNLEVLTVIQEIAASQAKLF